jgi:peptidoglycan LD-endopeptidase CwlK
MGLMAKLGQASLAKLATCHPELQVFVKALVEELPLDFDIRVECGHRDEADQEDCFARGTSKLHFPESEHNSWPSNAVDLTPWPSRWSDVEKQKKLREYALNTARRLGIALHIISWDLPHFGRVKPKHG